jgi:hypothetical protein
LLMARVIVLELPFLLWASDHADRIDSICLLNYGSFLRKLWTSKSFKLPNFLAHQFHVRITRVVEIEMHLFPWEMNHHTVACYAYKAKHR